MRAPETLHGTVITALAVFVVLGSCVAGGAVCGQLDRFNLRMQVEELKDQNAGLLHQLNETDARLDLCLNDGEVDE